MRATRTGSRFLPPLLALAACGALAAPASATVIYKAALSGRYLQQWQVHDPSGDCVSGGGTQTVQFQAVPNLLVAGSTEDDGGNPYSGGRAWQFGRFKVTGTISRTDTTATPAIPDCDGDPPLPAHDCGGPRRFTINDAYIYKSMGRRKARIHLELSGLDQLSSKLYSNSHQCYGPELNVDASRGFVTRWPGDRRVAKLHHSFTLAGTEPYPARTKYPDYLPGGAEPFLDITTSVTWKAELRAKCYQAAFSRALKCGRRASK